MDNSLQELSNEILENMSDNVYDWLFDDYEDEFLDYLSQNGKDDYADEIIAKRKSSDVMSEEYFTFIKKVISDLLKYLKKEYDSEEVSDAKSMIRYAEKRHSDLPYSKYQAK